MRKIGISIVIKMTYLYRVYAIFLDMIIRNYTDATTCAGAAGWT